MNWIRTLWKWFSAASLQGRTPSGGAWPMRPYAVAYAIVNRRRPSAGGASRPPLQAHDVEAAVNEDIFSRDAA